MTYDPQTNKKCENLKANLYFHDKFHVCNYTDQRKDEIKYNQLEH